MKKYILILAGAALLAACEQKTETVAPAASTPTPTPETSATLETSARPETTARPETSASTTPTSTYSFETSPTPTP